MNSETQLDDLLMRWEELRQQGQSVAAEDLCGGYPELQDELRRRIDALKAADDALAIMPSSGASTVGYEGATQRESREAAPRHPAAFPTIPGYDVLSELGEGGMGIVYKVRNISMDRLEALKVMRTLSASLAKRFEQEIRTTAKGDDRIVQIYHVGEHAGQRYYTMKYLESGTLADHLPRFRGKNEAVAILLAKVARAVHYLHDKGIVHRDLKPTNILLKENGDPLVSDFGLAKFFDVEPEPSPDDTPGGEVHLTRAGTAVGSPHYMSPEQTKGEVSRSAAPSDIWALGVILYELLTGEKPFDGKTRGAIHQAVLTTEPRAPRTLDRKIHKDLEAICLKCLKKDPRERYESAKAIAEDLESWLSGDPISIVPDPLWRRMWRQVKRRPVLSSVVALSVFFAIVLWVVANQVAPDINESEARLMQQGLNAGKSVNFIKNDKPRRLVWPLGKAGLLEANPGSGIVCFQTFNTSLLEVISDPGIPSYQFRAKIRHEEGDLNSEVGLYFLQGQYESPQGPFLGFCTVTFNDLHDQDAMLAKFGVPKEALKGNQLPTRVSFCRDLDKVEATVWYGKTDLSTPAFFKPALRQQGAGPWRELGIAVTPEKIDISFDGKEVTALTRKEVLEMARGAVEGGPELVRRPEFQLGRGLGLFCNAGVVAFKEVRLEPF